jgi:hypothetical protein
VDVTLLHKIVDKANRNSKSDFDDGNFGLKTLLDELQVKARVPIQNHHEMIVKTNGRTITCVYLNDFDPLEKLESM